MPNCDRNNGGPPYFSVLIFTLCWISYFVYNLGEEARPNVIHSPWIFRHDIAGSQIWRYFTYSFMHADLKHIVGNMVIFMLICPLLELAHDSFRPAGIYIIGVICGSILSAILAPKVYLCGASGGVYALVLAHIANIIMNGDIMDKGLMTIRLVVLAPLVLTAIWDVWNAYQRYFNNVTGLPVSYAAHVSGTITGLFLGTFLLRNFKQQKWEKILMVVFFSIFGAFFLAIVIMSFMGVHVGDDLVKPNVDPVVKATD